MSDLTLAASEAAFVELFTLVRDGFTFVDADSGTFGPFSASYSVALHLENGTIQLNDDGTLEIDALDVVWDTLMLKVCFDFPGFTIPGFCVIPDPWNGCLVGIPDIPIGGPICIPLNLSGLVSEISKVRAHLETQYFVDPARPPGVDRSCRRSSPEHRTSGRSTSHRTSSASTRSTFPPRSATCSRT